MKLKVELLKVFDKGLAMRILEQDESLRGVELLYESNGFEMRSVGAPDLQDNTCYVRGSYKCCDKMTIFREYDSKEQRDQMYEFILEAQDFLNNPKPLTFERIKNECVSMKHLLVDKGGEKRLYLGFNRTGSVVTDNKSCWDGVAWNEQDIADWTVEPYEVE